MAGQNERLPPAIQLLFNENLHQCQSGPELLAAIQARDVQAALREQAQYSLRSWLYADSKPIPSSGQFIVATGEALSPTTIGEATCPTLACHRDRAERFARSVGVYADRALVVDTISPLLADDHDIDDRGARMILADLVSIQALLPLVDAGVLSFSGPGHHYCEHCRPELTEVGQNTLATLTDILLADLSVRRVESTSRGAMVYFNMPAYFGSRFSTALEMPKHDAKAFAAICHGGKQGKLPAHLATRVRRVYRANVEKTLKIVTSEVVSAQKTGATFLAGTRAEAQTLKYLVESAMPGAKPDAWEMGRSVVLPWVNELSIEDVLRLRDEASRALPALRSRLARQLHTASEEAVTDTVAELAQEATEVEAELAACHSAGGQLLRVGIGSLGLSFVFYGLSVGGAQGVATTAIGSLITALNAMHPQAAKEKLEIEKLKGKPAFALVKAKELLHGHR